MAASTPLSTEVRRLRTERGWSQETLAAAAGLSLSTVVRVERGSDPSVDAVRKLATALDVTAGALLDAEPVEVAP